MEPERWRQIEELYHAALERAPDERAAFLAEICADDFGLRREVEELLRFDGAAESFIEEHALVVEARQLEAEDLSTIKTQGLIGQQIGAYKILAPLGKGGMGEVYLALDPRLGRKVALKLLPAAFTHDRERVRRFEQEARAASALNHPNIITIHEIGKVQTETGDMRYIVTEYVEGETLRQRMASAPQKQMKLSEAIELAAQIASALAAAHEAGITHRDIKPENVMARRDGIVKVLDFGLAKLTEPQAPVPSVPMDTQVPTVARAGSEAGVAMGTPRYMSPEQARGEKVDARTDIFSLGVVVYEMLAGRAPFTGATTSEVIAAILRDEPPDLTETNSKVPPQLERIVRHCLEKNPVLRFQSARDLTFALEALPTPLGAWADRTMALSAMTDDGSRPQLLDNARLAWVVAAVFLVGLLALSPIAIAWLRRTPAEAHTVRSFILPPEKSSFASFGSVAVSPDGRRLAFVAMTAEGKQFLWVRAFDTLSAQPLAGAEGATLPFWSPDSRSIGFFADEKLKKIDAAGGPALTLCDAPLGRGGAWNRDGVIVFAPKTTGALQRVPDSGGTSSVATRPDETRGATTERWPYFLPDGEHFLFLSGVATPSKIEKAAVYVASLTSKESKLLLLADSNAVYAQGYLIFLREGMLMAQPLDTKRLELMGEASTIAEQVQFRQAQATGTFSVSEQGILVYQAGAGVSGSQLAWFDRTGKPLGVLGDLVPYGSLHLSPDGKRATVAIEDPQIGRPDLWLYDVARGLRTRFTFDPAGERAQAWSPDGSRIVFNSDRKGHFDLYQKASSGAGNEELLLESRLEKFPTSISPDGRFLLYEVFDSKSPKTKKDLWVLPLEGSQKPFPFLQTEFSESYGEFSPDGRWVAYQSDESRRNEIYVAPFPGPGGKQPISSSGGQQPKWRGKEIFYLAPDNMLMVAEVNGKGATLEVVAVRPLFEVRPSGLDSVYDVTADGQRFLVNTAVEQKASAPITLALNWTAGVKK